jgi:hypothetical protein
MVGEQRVRMILKARGVQARWFGEGVDVVRGRQTTRIPVVAIERVAADDYGTVRITIASWALDGVDSPQIIEFRPTSRPEAQAFVELVGSAVAAARRVDRDTTVRVSREKTPGAWSKMSVTGRILVAVISSYAVFALADIMALGTPAAFFVLIPAGFGTFVAVVLLLSLDDFIQYWTSFLARGRLRRIGISVPARRVENRSTDGGFKFLFPVYEYTTVEGRVLTAPDRSGGGSPRGGMGFVVRYDPDDPTRVVGPVSIFAFIGYAICTAILFVGLAILPTMTGFIFLR